MLKKTIGMVAVFILSVFVTNLPAIGTSSDKISEHFKLFKKAIEQTRIQLEDRDRIIETLQQLRGSNINKGPIHFHDDSQIFLLRKKSL